MNLKPGKPKEAAGRKIRLPTIPRETGHGGELPPLEEARKLLWEDSSGGEQRIKFWDEV